MVYKIIGYLALVAIYYFIRVHGNGGDVEVVTIVAIFGLVALIFSERKKGD